MFERTAPERTTDKVLICCFDPGSMDCVLVMASIDAVGAPKSAAGEGPGQSRSDARASLDSCKAVISKSHEINTVVQVLKYVLSLGAACDKRLHPLFCNKRQHPNQNFLLPSIIDPMAGRK